MVFERDFRFHESPPRETLITLARRHIGGAFGDRHQPAQTRRARSHGTLSLARPSTNLLHDVSGIIRWGTPIAEPVNDKSNGPANSLATRLVVVARCHASWSGTGDESTNAPVVEGVCRIAFTIFRRNIHRDLGAREG